MNATAEVKTGVTPSSMGIIRTIGNRYRIAWHENKIDDQIAPEQGISGFLFDKVEDTANFLTMGAVARAKDGIKTKGYKYMSGEEMDQALITQYSENVAEKADKKETKQQKQWEKLEKQMDKLSSKDQDVDTIKQRAAKAAAMLGISESEDSDTYQME